MSRQLARRAFGSIYLLIPVIVVAAAALVYYAYRYANQLASAGEKNLIAANEAIADIQIARIEESLHEAEQTLFNSIDVGSLRDPNRLKEIVRLAPIVESTGVAVLAPDSRGRTWDVILGEQSTLLDIVSGQRRSSGFGPDVAFLDRALERVFQKVNVDPARLAVGGFSDGATYALSLGLINGELFRRILAFSPGFFVEGEPHGRPRVFISHGRSDDILPIDQCSRRIVPLLQKRGYDVTFREFDGRHEVPEAIARDAFIALAGTTGK